MNRFSGTVLDGQPVRMLSDGLYEVKTQTNVLKTASCRCRFCDELRLKPSSGAM